VLAGKVTVRASAPDRSPLVRTIEVAAGAQETVVLTFATEVDDAPASTVAPTEPDAPAESHGGGGLSTLQGIGVGVAAVGIAGLGLGVVTGVMAQGKANELEDECGGERCTDPATADVVDEGETLRTIANVGLFAGGALLVTGVALLVFGGSDDPDGAARAPRPLVAAGPAGGFVGVRGGF
jgi:hypothetical protein